MQAPLDSPMIPLVEKWAAHFGYYDDKIDLSVDEFDSFTTPDCTLTAHAPLWRTKSGEERAIRVAAVRAQLAKMQRMSRVARHDLHLALHPESDALALFFRVEGRLAFVPFTMMKVPLVLIVQAVETETGLRISEIHERRAANIRTARDAVVDHHGWPKDTVFEPYDGFGGV